MIATVLQRAFQHRSGRVISLCRLVLALVFLTAIWLDPAQPTRFEDLAYTILIAYFMGALAYLVLTWSNWWLDDKLSVPAHFVDITLFAVMVFVTDGYTSPFFTFFVFIILSATIRFGWRETAYTGLAVTSLFFVAGAISIASAAGDLEIMRLVVRGSYLIVLTILLIWFSVNQRDRFMRQLPSLHLNEEELVSSLPVEKALKYAAQRTGACAFTLVWWEEEEPWLNVGTLRGAMYSQEKLSPGRFSDIVNPEVSGCTFLFDNERGQILVKRGSEAKRGVLDAPLDRKFAEEYGLGGGVVTTIKTKAVEGVLITSEFPGACVDDLLICERIGEEVSAAFHRSSTIAISEEASAVRTRLSFARDLHDSVAQLLAGTSFRVAGIKKTLRKAEKLGRRSPDFSKNSCLSRKSFGF